MEDQQLREFVLGVCDQRIFTSDFIRRPEELRMVFMVVGLGGFADWTREELAQIGCFWEYMEAAGPRAVNGYPMFMSVRVMNKEDHERARKAIVAELERRKGIEV